MIKEAYVSFEVAKLLKEKGFNWPCRVLYSYIGEFNNDVCNRDVDWNSISPFGDISAPTHQMAMAWLREVHHLEIYPSHDSFQEHCNWWFSISKFTKGYSDCPYESDSIYFTYEEAVEAALKYCLENLI